MCDVCRNDAKRAIAELPDAQRGAVEKYITEAIGNADWEVRQAEQSANLAENALDEAREALEELEAAFADRELTDADFETLRQALA